MAKSGFDYERKKARQISLWLSNGERNDIVWRTSGSGARATVRMKKNKETPNSCGDLNLLDFSHEIGKKFFDIVLIELKKGYDDAPSKKNKTGNKTGEKLSFVSLIDTNFNKRYPLLIRWMNKAIKEATLHNKKIPILIFCRTRKQDCICMLEKDFDYLRDNNGTSWMFPHDGCTARIYYAGQELFIARLEDFLYWCNPQAFYQKIFRLKKRIPYRKGQYTKGKSSLKDL